MKSKLKGLVLGSALGLASFSVLAQSWTVPAPAQRCPSKWSFTGSTVAPVAIR